MRTYGIIIYLFILCTYSASSDDEVNEETVLYYYGLEESERGLPLCAARQACSALLRRYWRGPALVRLCRCGRAARRVRCDTPAPPRRRLPLNNRAYLQFCQPVDSWPQCKFGELPLSVDAAGDHLDPDLLEKMHNENIHLSPPRIVFECRCSEPNYWKLNTTSADDSRHSYQCSSLPLCNTGEFCGNVNYELGSLYQSCLCPKGHMCVHNGGIPRIHLSELMYQGRGWRAHCQRIATDQSYEDY